jgi:hypothetical protein
MGDEAPHVMSIGCSFPAALGAAWAGRGKPREGNQSAGTLKR